jgi:hypothetical protein
MAEFTSLNQQQMEAIHGLYEIPIIGSNSNNNMLKIMITTMKNNADVIAEGRYNHLNVEYTLGGFITNLVNGLKPDAISSEIDVPDYQQNILPINWQENKTEYFFTMAEKIKRTIFNETPTPNNTDYFYFNQAHIDQMPGWSGYMNTLRSSNIHLYRHHDPSQGEYAFRINIPASGTIPGRILSLDAYNIVDFLFRIKFHIMEIAEEYYNIDPRDTNNANFHPGGRKHTKRRTNKKSLKKRRKTNRKIKKGGMTDDNSMSSMTMSINSELSELSELPDWFEYADIDIPEIHQVFKGDNEINVNTLPNKIKEITGEKEDGEMNCHNCLMVGWELGYETGYTDGASDIYTNKNMIDKTKKNGGKRKSLKKKRKNKKRKTKIKKRF